MMDAAGKIYNSSTTTTTQSEEDLDLKRGPWTVDEDVVLINYIANHGEGRWNSLARSAGLKRTGKSCRLRWLNYLRPDVRRGNITLEEQLTILQLHSQWGNRWSKIAQHLPGRTDNEIKNYWRTRVQKHAKQLRCDVNSKLFRDTMRYLWMPRLIERIHATTTSGTTTFTSTITTATNSNTTSSHVNSNNNTHIAAPRQVVDVINMSGRSSNSEHNIGGVHANRIHSSTAVSSDIQKQSPASELEEKYCAPLQLDNNHDYYSDSMTLSSPLGYFNNQSGGLGFQEVEQTNMWLGNEDFWENLWNVGDMCFSN